MDAQTQAPHLDGSLWVVEWLSTRCHKLELGIDPKVEVHAMELQIQIEFGKFGTNIFVAIAEPENLRFWTDGWISGIAHFWTQIIYIS